MIDEQKAWFASRYSACTQGSSADPSPGSPRIFLNRYPCMLTLKLTWHASEFIGTIFEHQYFARLRPRSPRRMLLYARHPVSSAFHVAFEHSPILSMAFAKIRPDMSGCPTCWRPLAESDPPGHRPHRFPARELYRKPTSGAAHAWDRYRRLRRPPRQISRSAQQGFSHHPRTQAHLDAGTASLLRPERGLRGDQPALLRGRSCSVARR